MSDDEGRFAPRRRRGRDPQGALDAIRALDAAPAQGRASARGLLANLLGSILSGETRLSAPGQVLLRLEQVVSHVGAPGALFRTLLEDDELRERLLIGLDAGDLFAARLSAYPELLDFLASVALEPESFRAAVAEAFDAVVAGGDDFESRFDRSAA